MDFVAVVSPGSFADEAQLKRLLLLFDRLAVDLRQQRLSTTDQAAIRMAGSAIHFLTSENLLTTVEGHLADQALPPLPGADVRGDPRNAEELGLKGIGRVLRTASGRIGGAGRIRQSAIRDIAGHLRKTAGVDAVAVGDALEALDIDATAARSDVIRVTLNALPVPTAATPWQDVASYRNDQVSHGQHLKLKNWINRTAKEGLAIYELQSELEELLFEYGQHIRFHKIKSADAKVDIFVSAPPQKGAPATSKGFSVTPGYEDTSTTDRRLPGLEVAYIYHTKQRFGRADDSLGFQGALG